MIEKICFKKYRKIKDLAFNFSNSINVISGTNGTCKSSLLHIISNSFQAVHKNCSWLNEDKCIDVLRKINSNINPKVESLTCGDKAYNDPAKGHKGPLYKVDYYDKNPLEFRRHNSKINNRYSVKPRYPKGSSDSLPHCPVVYLGLSRLVPFGEFNNEEQIVDIKKSLPIEYVEKVADIYNEFTGINISSTVPQKLGDVKVRIDFNSDYEGIDSNTISAGEDNLIIIINALVSLSYYYESIQSNNKVESILLIDELDATLHPKYQLKLLELLESYSAKFKIQICFTTHSLFLIEYAIKKSHNVIYLIDNIDSIIPLDDPDIHKIKMHLQTVSRRDIYYSKVIPIFTEDKEARQFLSLIFDYFQETDKVNFPRVRCYFHFVDANIGAEDLFSIFDDSHLLKSTLQAICILDGDKRFKRNLNKNIIILPGNESPEFLILNYSKELFEDGSDFWEDYTILEHGYGKLYYRNNILPEIEGIISSIKEYDEKGKSIEGLKRKKSKVVFSKHNEFFLLLFKHWIHNQEHEEQLFYFYQDLYKMFKKVAAFHGVNSNEWSMQDK